MAWVTFLIAIIVITVILAWFAGLFGCGGNSRLIQVEGDMKSFEAALRQYRRVTGSYPSDSQGLDALLNKPSDFPAPYAWRQMMNKISLDPWGGPYFYRLTGRRNPAEPEIISMGPDGIRHTTDDLGNQNE